MTGREIIKHIMEEQGVTNYNMAGKLGISQQALWDRLNNKKVKDIPTSLLSEMLNMLDYKVIIVPRETRLPMKGYEIK